MPELVACQTAPARVARLAWARRLRRLTPLPCPLNRVFGSGLRLDVLGEELTVGVECRGLRHGIAEFDATACAQSTPTGAPRLVSAAKGPRLRATPIRAMTVGRHALSVTTSSNEPSMTDRARVALPCVLMQLLKLRNTATSQGCKYDVLRGGMEAQHDVCGKSGPHGGQGAVAGVDVGHVPEKDPRLSFAARVQHVVQCGREVQDRGRRGPAVLGRDVVSELWPGMLRQDGVCLVRVHDLHQHVQRATVQAEGDRECRGLRCVAL